MEGYTNPIQRYQPRLTGFYSAVFLLIITVHRVMFVKALQEWRYAGDRVIGRWLSLSGGRSTRVSFGLVAFLDISFTGMVRHQWYPDERSSNLKTRPKRTPECWHSARLTAFTASSRWSTATNTPLNTWLCRLIMGLLPAQNSGWGTRDLATSNTYYGLTIATNQVNASS